MGNIVYQKLPLYNTQAKIIFFHINKKFFLISIYTIINIPDVNISRCFYLLFCFLNYILDTNNNV